MTNLFLTFAAGLVCGYIFYKAKVPGGMMVGAIVGVAALNILWGISYMPNYAKYAAQIIAGAFIGCTVEKSDIKRFKYIVKPALVLISAMLLLNITLGFTIYLVSPLDMITSLMSCIPGGMTEIPIISADMGADVPKVAVLQFIRMITCIGLFPTLISMIGQHHNNVNNISETYETTCPIEPARSRESNQIVFTQTMVVAVLGGIIGRILKIPAGVLLFSMIGVICFKLFLDKAYMPIWAKRLAQTLSGAYIGCSINYSDILEIKYLIIPAVLIVVGYFITCFVVGRILSRHFGMSIKEAMLAATPAGASDMALISSDIGVHSTDLMVLQIIRLLVVISLFPQIISLIVALLVR